MVLLVNAVVANGPLTNQCLRNWLLKSKTRWSRIECTNCHAFYFQFISQFWMNTNSCWPFSEVNRTARPQDPEHPVRCSHSLAFWSVVRASRRSVTLQSLNLEHRDLCCLVQTSCQVKQALFHCKGTSTRHVVLSLFLHVSSQRHMLGIRRKWALVCAFFFRTRDEGIKNRIRRRFEFLHGDCILSYNDLDFLSRSGFQAFRLVSAAQEPNHYEKHKERNNSSWGLSLPVNSLHRTECHL